MQSQIAESYQRDGFYLPCDVLGQAQAEALRADLESAEKDLSDQPDVLAILRASPDRLLPSFDELICDPRLIDAVSQILGPDLMVWNAGMFTKEANSAHYVSWHQDLTYWGLSEAEEVTAWVALSPSTPASGCMQFIPGSHRHNIVAHTDSFADDNLLTRGQEIAVEVDESVAVDASLKPGQASLHHGHLFHASGPNQTDDRRLGFAIRYIKPSMKQSGGHKTMARLVSGEDRYGHFALASAPVDRLSPVEIKRCQDDAALRREVLYAGAEDKAGKRY